MRKQNVNKPRACEIKIWVALAMLLRVGITIYKVMSLTIDQLQLSNNPRKKMYVYFYFYILVVIYF